MELKRKKRLTTDTYVAAFNESGPSVVDDDVTWFVILIDDVVPSSSSARAVGRKKVEECTTYVS